MAEHPELKKLRGFIVHSEEYSQKNIVFSYYLKAYACQRLFQRIQELKSKGENTVILEQTATQWIQELERIKQSGSVAIENREQYYQDMKNYSLKVFLDADNEERDGKANKFTMKNFETASRFLEALGVFGKGEKDIDDKKKYAKVKAVQIMKMLKDPQLYQQYQDRIQNQKNCNQYPIQPQIQSNLPQTNQFMPQQTPIQSQFKPMSSNAPQKRIEAKKLCETAIAEIKNSRYGKAKDHISKALCLLENI